MEVVRASLVRVSCGWAEMGSGLGGCVGMINVLQVWWLSSGGSSVGC